MPNTQENRKDSLAREVLLLARNTLLVNLRFMDMALSRLELVPGADSIAVDGRHIFYDPGWVLRCYKCDQKAMTRNYLHMVFHCIFQHAFVDTLLDLAAWDLACDIAVECAINDLEVSCTESPRQDQQKPFLDRIGKDVKIFTAEKIYAYLQNQNFSQDQLIQIRQVFLADDHSLWYKPRENNVARGNGDNEEDNKNNNDDNNGPTDSRSDRDSESMPSSDGEGSNQLDLRQDWRGVAQRMQTDLETFSRQQGFAAGNMTQNLRAVTREKYDYAEFLRRFAVMGEVMKVNDDEFDYIFYSYGLQLYKKMPLIEPLEYKEVKRIKEFVIAIDTSGSTSGELVQKFVQKTYNILKQQESFFTKINLHIIQCDAEIQEDVKITSQEEFDEYIRDMTIHGLGGTNFCPVFDYVEQLRKAHELTNIKGLIYFTDGYGEFPARQPDYHAAFVYVDDGYNNPNVPVWAIKLVLQKEEI